jgi:hypothetical protein
LTGLYKFVAIALVIAIAVALANAVDGRAGDPVAVQGKTTQMCVAAGQKGHYYFCFADLTDGSQQTFSTRHPVDKDTVVKFDRYNRRFGGFIYEYRP